MIDEEYFVEDILVAWRYPWDNENDLFVFPLPYQYGCINQEEAIIREEKANEEIDKLRVAMFTSGYWWSISLPYENHPEGGLLVIHHSPLDWEVTFEQPWDFPTQGYDPSPTARESFCPPVPISARPGLKRGDITWNLTDLSMIAGWFGVGNWRKNKWV